MTQDHTENLADRKILVVDDEQVLAWSMSTALEKAGATVTQAHSAEQARTAFATETPDVVICDLKLPDGSGLDLLEAWRKSHPQLPVILITAHGAVETAISAVRLAAFDYLQKPFNMKDLVAATGRAAEISSLRQKVSRMESALTGKPKLTILGKSSKMVELRRQLERVAATNCDTVLVHGETGAGKELVARALHEWSSRSAHPYIEINCASIPENLLESELFGYEKGAFTDARSRKLGLFEIAKNGTLFLDEIGELPLKLQAKLLRALEYRRFKRLGGTSDLEFNARVVAATNRDLPREIAENRFRADLYYRLNAIPLKVPPLRMRKGDIPQLARFFVEQISHQLNLPAPQLSKEAEDHLSRHDWPGNVRELRNALQRAIVLHGQEVLRPEHISWESIPKTTAPLPSPQPPFPGIDPAPTHTGTDSAGFVLPADGVSLEDLERDVIQQALVRSHYNQSRAADLLNITRHTLRYRLEKHGLLEK